MAPKVEFVPMHLIPRKITLKIKPHLHGGTLYLKGVFETERGDHKNLAGFVTHDLAMAILTYLQQEKMMETTFLLNTLISVKGIPENTEKTFTKTEDHFEFSGIPDYATFYKSKYHLSIYLHIEDKTLTGWVSLKWVGRVLGGMLENQFLLFKVKKDYCDRENFLNLAETYALPSLCKSCEPCKIAFLEE